MLARPLTMWERYSDDWNQAIERDDRARIEDLWWAMNWSAFHQRDEIPNDLLPWVYMRNTMRFGKDAVLAPIISGWIQLVADWAREQATTRYRE